MGPAANCSLEGEGGASFLPVQAPVGPALAAVSGLAPRMARVGWR